MTCPTLNSDLNMFVTYMDADGPFLRVWAQTNKDEVSIVERLIHALTGQFEKGLGCLVPQKRAIWPNLICCAMYERTYCRVKILAPENGGYLVQFIDYGNTESLQPCDIRLLEGIPEAADLLRIPPLATDFVVADILPRARTWEGPVLGSILRNIRYGEYPAKIINVHGKLRLVRMLFGGRNFADVLVEQNWAVHASNEEIFRARACAQQSQMMQMPKPLMQIQIQGQPPPRDNPASKYPSVEPLRVARAQHHPDNWRVQPTSMGHHQHQKMQQTSPLQVDDAGVFRSRILEIGSRHEVSVSYVEDGPLMFSVQVKSTFEELNNLMSNINQMHSPQPLVEPPVIGTVCLGRYTVDKRLLRAVVMQVREHDCKLHYVDYGHVEILPYSDVYQLPRQYINPRVLSIRLTMSDVVELQINDEMKDYFKRYVAGKTFLLHVRPSEGSPLIQYGELYENGRNVKDVLRSAFEDPIGAWPSPKQLLPESREFVKVVDINSAVIYVQLDSEARLFETLVARIGKHVATAPRLKPNQLTNGLQCLAFSSRHCQWYRAEIVNVSGDNARVFYVDYGKEETIATTSLRAIRDSALAKVRAQAIRCILNDYDKEITSEELYASLRAELLSKVVAMIVSQVTTAGLIVDLYDASIDPLVGIMQKLKRASVVNGNVEARIENNYNDKSNDFTHSNLNRSDVQTTKWNQRSEAPKFSERNNSTETGKSNNWRNKDNETRRDENRDNRYQTRDKEWSPNNGQTQNDKFSRNDSQNERSPREASKYERNERFDRSSDANANIRPGRDNRERGGRGTFANARSHSGNNWRNERNGSAEKTWSDKDSDTSSKGSGRGGRRGARGSDSRGRRDPARTPNTRDSDGESDRANFKNTRVNGASPRIRDNRRDFGDKYEMKPTDARTTKTPPAPKNFSIPKPNITVGAVKNCELVYRKDPGDFHVHLSPDNVELDPVMAKIDAIYENGGKILDRGSIKEGTDCVAQYSEDSRWYRANVQSVEANGATVRFVDYGNVETVKFDKIKELEADCAKLSAQAIACKLLAINKTTWSIEDIDRFDQLTENKCLEAEFVAASDNVFQILLRETIDGSPATSYINEEFSEGADLAQAKNNARSKGRQRAGQTIVSTDYVPIDQKWLVEDCGPGNKENVIITWFTNPESFYCQTLARKDEFRAMMNEIQQVYVNRQPVNEPLQVGSAVMAVFSDDGAIYRAEVLALNKERGNIVRYIDFGNTAMVENRNTYRVEKKFMNMPKQAVACSLKNIVPANGTSWTKTNQQDIERCFESENLECIFHEFKDAKYIVSLRSEDADVAGLLVEKSLASFAVSAHVNIEKNEVETVADTPIEELPRFDISLLAGQVLRVKVSNVASAAKFHIQLPSVTATETAIDAYMAQNDSNVMPKLSYREVCLGAGCLVNTDEGWRRAVVVNCSGTTGFHVRLIDTGANDEIPLNCMLALPSPLSVMQNQAVECCLKNAKSDIVLDEKLRDKIENTNVIVAIEEVDNNRLIVKLYDENGKSIKLTEDEETEEICPICPMPILYSTQKVAVSHVENSSSVWLKRTLDLDADADLLSRLYERYSASGESDERLPSVVPGTLCAARSADENWYRSRIIRATEHGATVRYIDYGNEEDIPLENLRLLAADFNAQTQLAIEVALTVTLGGTADDQMEILKTHLLDQQFTATMYNVHKKWVAELTNNEGKISEKLSGLEAIEISTNPNVQAVISEMVVGGRYNVTCHHADSPASFWLQRNEEVAAIEQLQERLQIEANECPTLEGTPEEGTICLAMYSVDDLWYRAEVIVADPEITSVRFVDYGNTDVVYTNQGKSKIIPDSLKSIKRYAIKCRLDVIPYGAEDWTSAAIAWFEGAVASAENMEALVIADSAPRRVELFVNGESLVDELVRRNHASRIHTEDDLIEEIIERDVDPRAAYVSHAVSPNEFWVQQEKYVGDLEILADRFIVADMFPKPREIKEGLLCVAKFPEDDAWYRARVITHSDSMTEVIYIDYGNSAVSTEIREIPEDVAAQPAFSKKCRLAIPEHVEQWSEEACIEFVTMAADGATIFQLDVLEEREDTSIVRLTQDGRDIVESLVELCTPRLPVIEERLPPLGEENSPNVIVSHANSPADFSIQAESSIAELEVMVDHLVAAESFLPLEHLEEGMICAAKFPEDDQWYRAKILSHGDAGTEVLYIDYGNSAITTELRVLPEDIVRKPALSTCCSLRMPDNAQSWSQDACEKFFDLVNEGITMFEYEVLEDKEPAVVRLSVDGQDIVEILAPLCAEQLSEGTASLERDETASNDTGIRETIADQDYPEIAVTHGDTLVEERTSSCETSGVEIVTISSDASSLDCSSKSHDETVFSCSASFVRVEEMPSNEKEESATLSHAGEVAEGTSRLETVGEGIENTEERVANDDVKATGEGLESMGKCGPENEESRPKSPPVEKTLPNLAPLELTEQSAIPDRNKRRNSTPLDEKIVPGCINKGNDLTVDNSSAEQSTGEIFDETTALPDEDAALVLARKLSFDQSPIVSTPKADSATRNVVAPPTTPKTPHSEKIVAGVVSIHEKLEDFEKDEIISVESTGAKNEISVVSIPEKD